MEQVFNDVEQTPSQHGVALGQNATRSVRRNTPYHKTPKSRRLTLSGRKSLISKTKARSRDPPSFKGLVSKTWKLYRLSPLYKFNTNSKIWKKYSGSLSAFIAAEKRKSFSPDTEDAEKVVISAYKGLRIEAGDPESIQILVTGKSKPGIDTKTVVLTAVLCGVDIEESPVHPEETDFVYYPVMMVKGSAALSKLIVLWLEEQFDCRVSPFCFSSADLAWMVAMWSGQTTEGKNKPVELLYTLPSEVEGLSKITYTIDAEDCQELWDSVHDTTSDEFKGEEVGAFIKGLETHFYNCFKVMLSAIYLSRIGTSVVCVGSEGRIKFFSERQVLQVLRHITELAVEHFKSP